MRMLSAASLYYRVSAALVKSLGRVAVPRGAMCRYLLCVAVARTQLAITGPVLPEDELLFNQSLAERFDSSKQTP